jgi:GTP cyclohydrolase IA
MTMDPSKLEAGFRLVLEGLGVDLNHPQLRGTPRRTAEAWYEEICSGLRETDFSLEVFPVEEGYQTGMVALNRIPVKSICAHHLLPFNGEATVAYLPNGQICGLSKLSRVVNHFARRPQLQEHLTHEIAQFLESQLDPMGVGVIVQASHACMELRGVNHPGIMTTTTLLGAFRTDAALRAEFMALAPRLAAQPQL